MRRRLPELVPRSTNRVELDFHSGQAAIKIGLRGERASIDTRVLAGAGFGERRRKTCLERRAPVRNGIPIAAVVAVLAAGVGTSTARLCSALSTSERTLAVC